jgi:hypothetical protein
LTNTLTDGWFSRSLVTCSDCHGSNASGAPAGPHGSGQKWILKGVDINVKVTIANGTVTTPNSGTAAAAIGNYCLNCHRQDVYGNGEGTNGAYQNLSRISHMGQINGSCTSLTRLKAPFAGTSGCYHCHGGRKDESSYGATSATVQSGAIHGTSMGLGIGSGPTARLYSGIMGNRFSNGASWLSHDFADTAGSVGCQTYNKSTDADGYTACTQHGGGRTAGGTNYWYALP